MMKIVKSSLHTFECSNKRVFLRVDLNVALQEGKIISDFRLKAIMPTLELLLKKGAKIILATHIGRPQGTNHELTTQHLIPWFIKQGYSITYEPDLLKAYKKSFEAQSTILLLENLRFYPGEKNEDPVFAQSLGALADFYVNDAFGLMHRTDCSLYALPLLFPASGRSVGLLVEREIDTIENLFNNKSHPFVCIIGGLKVKEKLAFINYLLPKIDLLILVPAMVFSFLKAKGQETGNSFIDNDALKICSTIMENATRLNKKIIMPLDYLVSANKNFATLTNKQLDEFNVSDIGITIGSATQKQISTIISKAKLCLYNGLMGFMEYPHTLQGVDAIFKAMGSMPGKSIVAGGDSVAAIQALGYEENIDFMSTAGGALLSFLTDHPMPALELYR